MNEFETREPLSPDPTRFASLTIACSVHGGQNIGPCESLVPDGENPWATQFPEIVMGGPSRRQRRHNQRTARQSLRREMGLHYLGEIYLDPTTIQVMHGSFTTWGYAFHSRCWILLREAFLGICQPEALQALFDVCRSEHMFYGSMKWWHGYNGLLKRLNKPTLAKLTLGDDPDLCLEDIVDVMARMSPLYPPPLKSWKKPGLRKSCPNSDGCGSHNRLESMCRHLCRSKTLSALFLTKSSSTC